MSETTGTIGRCELHTREVRCVAYLRDDGLIDIEGCMEDVKPHVVTLSSRTVQAHEPFHEIHLDMTVDQDFVIREVRARIEASPTQFCRDIEPAYDRLLGLKIGPGFRKEVSARLGGLKGCTHLTDLLVPMATTLYQGTFELKRDAQRIRMVTDPSAPPPLPPYASSCHVGAHYGNAAPAKKAEMHGAPQAVIENTN